MADDFEKFKKMYKEGEVKVLANPPPMPGPSGAAVSAARGAVMNRGRKLLMDKLGKSRDANAAARAASGKVGSKAGGKAAGTSAPSGSSAAPQAGRASGGTSAPGGARSAAQAGRKSSGTSAPGRSAGRPQTGRKSGGTSAPGGSAGRPQAGRNSGSAKPTGKSAATVATRTFGGKMKVGAAAGAGLLGFAAYKAADKPKASDNKVNNSKLTSGARDDRASSGSSKADAFRKKRQGMNVPGSPTNPGTNKDGPKNAGDKSRVAKPEKKMSNFERMKKRQYEKEGYGGRSMTSRGAESRVKKERSFKFKDLFAKKK